jgi:IS5 family transposase
VKRDFGITKTRYRGLAKNLNLIQVAMASANLLMTARATVIQTAYCACVRAAVPLVGEPVFR